MKRVLLFSFLAAGFLCVATAIACTPKPEAPAVAKPNPRKFTAMTMRRLDRDNVDVSEVSVLAPPSWRIPPRIDTLIEQAESIVGPENSLLEMTSAGSLIDGKHWGSSRLILVQGLAGEFYPCGCTTGQEGGAVKLMTAIRVLQTQAPDVKLVLGTDNLEHPQADQVLSFLAPEERDARRKTVSSILASVPVSPTNLDQSGLPIVLTKDRLRGQKLGMRPPLEGGREFVALSLFYPLGGATNWESVANLQTLVDAHGANPDTPTGLIGKLLDRVADLSRKQTGFFLVDYQKVPAATPDDHVARQMVQEFEGSLRELPDWQSRFDIRNWNEEAEECARCHADFADAWTKESPHRHSLQTLTDAGRDNEALCASCHITRTFERMGSTEEALIPSVSCSSCHANARSHQRHPELLSPMALSANTCTNCHNTKQAPNFNQPEAMSRLPCVQVKQRR